MKFKVIGVGDKTDAPHHFPIGSLVTAVDVYGANKYIETPVKMYEGNTPDTINKAFSRKFRQYIHKDDLEMVRQFSVVANDDTESGAEHTFWIGEVVELDITDGKNRATDWNYYKSVNRPAVVCFVKNEWVVEINGN